MLKKSLELVGLTTALSAMLGMLIFAVCIGPLITWGLFNYISPVFGWNQISFLQAIALFVLVKILMVGFKFNGK